jgi:hypothetical protein
MKFKDIESVFAKAFNRTILLLFKPFSLKKWLLLGLIGFLAGFAASGTIPTGPSGNVSIPAPNNTPIANNKNNATTLTNEPTLEQVLDSLQSQPTPPAPYLKEAKHPDPPFDTRVALLIGLFLFLIFLPFWLIFAWLNGRFSFIFIHSIVNNTFSIRSPWNEFRQEGNSIFKLNVLLLILGLGLLFTFLGILYYCIPSSWSLRDMHWGPVIGVALFLFLLWFLGFVGYHYVAQFVVPIMYSRKIKFLQAFYEFWRVFKSNLGSFLLYLPLAILLGIVCSIFLFVVTMLLGLLLLIVGLIVFLLPILVVGTSSFYIAYCVLMGIIFIFLFFLMVLLAAAPVSVFYRSFTLAYLEKIDNQYLFYRHDNFVDPLPFETNPPSVPLPPQIS